MPKKTKAEKTKAETIKLNSQRQRSIIADMKKLKLGLKKLQKDLVIFRFFRE